MFKKTLALILTSLVSFNTMALSEEAVAYCEIVRENSTTIMELRQMGVSQAELKADFPDRGLSKIIDEAYNWTHVNTGYRKHTAKIFGTNMANTCYKIMLDEGL